ncbi:MAG: hypothetical protein H5T49_06150 [Hadesarchaea archaeon]|nr:hypothetical protein [Hadesarchaea archaeon]
MNFDPLAALKDLQDKEMELAKFYSDLIKEIRDDKLVKELKKIRRGEKKHVKLVQNIIAYEEERKFPMVFAKIEPAEDIVLEPGAVNLLVTQKTDWFSGILSVLKACKEKQVIYIALNKPAETLKPKFEEAEINLEKIKFVGPSKKNFMGKSELATLSLEKLNKIFPVPEKAVVIFDHINSLANYNPMVPLSRFLESAANRAAKEKFVLIFVATESASKQDLIDLLKGMAKHMIKVKKTPLLQ